ncbi:hypothetical protein J3F83DRAFT_300629 [Trichoderma novae-zelandiae]
MRDTWTPFVLGPEDDWSGVTNGEDRKRIQNRLSQRARRAHLKATRSTPKTSSATVADAGLLESSPDTTPSSSSESLQVDDAILESLLPPSNSLDGTDPSATLSGAHATEDISTTSPFTEVPTASRHSVAFPKTPPPNLDANFIFIASTSIVAAYASNATLLRISCASTHPRTFHISHSPAPTSLEPTLLQKTVPHPPFIDVIPFPGVRNRLIRSLEVIDLAKLSQDLVDGAFRVWGQASWDGMGWEVSEAFARRWWFLMDEQLIDVTNFWRRQRLEGALLLSNGEVYVEEWMGAGSQ